MSVVFVQVCLSDFMLLFNSSKLEEHVYCLGGGGGCKTVCRRQFVCTLERKMLMVLLQKKKTFQILKLTVTGILIE